MITRAMRAITAAKSAREWLGVKPSSAARRCSAAKRAARISALEGTQPVLRQSPPMLCCSISATLAFTAAAM
ncbi:hypothetical protein D3C84_1271720 [compost metagenome]